MKVTCALSDIQVYAISASIIFIRGKIVFSIRRKSICNDYASTIRITDALSVFTLIYHCFYSPESILSRQILYLMKNTIPLQLKIDNIAVRIYVKAQNCDSDCRGDLKGGILLIARLCLQQYEFVEPENRPSQNLKFSIRRRTEKKLHKRCVIHSCTCNCRHTCR